MKAENKLNRYKTTRYDTHKDGRILDPAMKPPKPKRSAKGFTKPLEDSNEPNLEQKDQEQIKLIGKKRDPLMKIFKVVSRK